MGTIDPPAVPLCAAIAAEIRAVRMMMEAIADILVADSTLVAARLVELQALDLAIQQADESADLLERLAAGVEAGEAVRQVRLAAVQTRLMAAVVPAGNQHAA